MTRVALIERYGDAPVVRDEPAISPDGAVVDLRAASLNPADLAIASGHFPAGSPPLPYVPGIDGVATVVRSQRFSPGTRVAVVGGGVGVSRHGTWAERFSVPEEALLPVADGVDDVTAAALVTPGLAAWTALTHAAAVGERDSVLVLGATGAVGFLAVQAAVALGAARVVAVGRDRQRLERCLDAGADAIVSADGDGLGAALAEAAGDDPPSVVVDPVFGAPFEAALAAAGRGARIIHLGQAAGPTATVPSGALRGKGLMVVGLSIFGVPRDVLERAYADMLGHVRDGRITVDDVSTRPLEQATEVWEHKARGERGKVVITR